MQEVTITTGRYAGKRGVLTTVKTTDGYLLPWAKEGEQAVWIDGMAGPVSLEVAPVAAKASAQAFKLDPAKIAKAQADSDWVLSLMGGL